MKIRLLPLCAAMLAAGPLEAQTFSTDVNITSSSATVPNLKVAGDGGVLFSAPGNATGGIPATGAGTRLMWYPGKSAFRAGVVTGAQWNDANVGPSSAAFGVDNQVPGTGGFATGSGNYVGYSWWSAAFGASNVLNNTSGTMIVGVSNLISDGYCNFVAGDWNTASGGTAVAIGEGSISSGWGAMTIGRALTSASAGCVVVGMSNVPFVGDATYWVGTDPVFVVGNGTANTATTSTTVPSQSDALVIYKNGAVKIPKRQGDIVMGEFGSGNGD